ncbi:DUF2946 family protein [Neorhizobium sp. BT27B]|uniref:DUF2946 family protein n=1 Tax=Neorhizobium sp. BT27B TaxID=3142625 RepID=UPI003D290293
MDARLPYIERLLIRILCVVAFVMVDASHRLPSAAERWEIVHSHQSMLPDGSIPSLCLTSGEAHPLHDGHDQHQKTASAGCEACRLAASSLLPLPADISGLTTRFYTVVEQIKRDILPSRRVFSPNNSPRAPPFWMT